MIGSAFLLVLSLDFVNEFVYLTLICVSHNQGIEVTPFILATTVVFHHLFVSINFLFSLGILPDEERTPIVLIRILEETRLLIFFLLGFLNLSSAAQ